MEDWQEAVWLALSLMFGVVIILFINYFMLTGQEINRSVANEESMNELMADFRQYQAYDGTVVMPQDVVSMIMKSRGEPYADVYDLNNTNRKVWCSSKALRDLYSLPTDSSTYDTEAVGNAIKQNVQYMCEIKRGASGEVHGIIFKATPPAITSP